MVALLAIAGAESFPVLAEGDQATTSGFLLQEEHLAAIEANNNTLAARITELEGQLATANENATQLTAAQQQVTSLQSEIAALKAAKPTFTETSSSAASEGSASAGELDEVTQQANKLRASMGMPLIK